jgi:hypothetical protein
VAAGREAIGDPMAFAIEAVNEGLSSRAALAAVRDAGWAISNERWASAYRNAGAAIDLAGGLGSVNYAQQLSPEMHAQWAAGQPGQYAYKVTMMARDPATGLVAQIPQMVASDVPLSPGEATQQVYDEWSDPENTNVYDLEPIGGVLTGAYRMTGSVA